MIAATVTSLPGVKSALLYRLVMGKHVCPWCLKSINLLERQGFKVEYYWLPTRQEADALMAKNLVKTTPQAFKSVFLTENLMMIGMTIWVWLQ